jgi:hypothetical protein
MDKGLPSLPVKIMFDVTTDPQVKAVWDHYIARNLMLLWRPCHLVNQYYYNETLSIARVIEYEKPKNITELLSCFMKAAEKGDRSNYKQNDLEVFLPEAMPFLLGEKHVSYELNID